MRISGAAILLVLALVTAGCSDPSSVPTAPSPVLPSASPPSPPQPPQPAPTQLVVFKDPATEFSTSDVRDVQDEIVRFNTADELIWTGDGTRFPEYIVDGNLIAYHHNADKFFQVRFGTKAGERRAYLTETDDRLGGAPATILDIEVVGGQLVITRTNVPVPGTS
jgi:hypothetical protein